MAAEVLLEADGRYTRDRLEPYRAKLQERYGSRHPAFSPSGLLPAGLLAWLGTRLIATPWFARRVVIDRWFLHADQPPLPGSQPLGHRAGLPGVRAS
jgi:hypothetical protein